MFCGLTFASSSESLVSYAAPPKTIDKIQIENAVYDEVYATVKVIELDDFDGAIPADWDFNTRFHALFSNSLHAGNVQFTEDIVDSIRIKKRTEKDNKFQTIYEREIRNKDDFHIDIIDYLEPIGNIEYAYVPVISGGENKYIINSVKSAFDSPFLVEKGSSYPIILDGKYSETINYESAQVKPLGRKYPITIVNGNTGYKTGDIEGGFIELKGDTFNIGNALDYRTIIQKFLTNKRPKIYKDVDGNVMMISVTSNISETSRSFYYHGGEKIYYVKSKFSYTECGDPYYVGDLYDNNFIDANVDR